MQARTEQKVWLITGCSRGIGNAIAHAALSAGDLLVATARNPETLIPFSRGSSNSVLCLKQDVTDFESNSRVIQSALDHFGRIDVLVNNAGFGLQGMMEELNLEQFRFQMETNFFGLLDLCKKVVPVMRIQNSGIIFNVSSIAGFRGTASFSAYNASKFAVNGISEALAQEVRQFGIQVVIVSPGPYRTDWAGNSLFRSDQMKVLVDASRRDNLPVHMFFGEFAIEALEKRLTDLRDSGYCSVFPHAREKV